MRHYAAQGPDWKLVTMRTFTVQASDTRRGDGRVWRVGAAVALSLLLHAMLLYGPRWNKALPAQAADVVPPLTVWLVPAPPKPIPAPMAPAIKADINAATKAAHKSATKSATKPAPPSRHTAKAAPLIQSMAVTALPSAPPAATTALAPAPSEAPPAPTFNMDGALATARRIANERDPARANTAVGQIPEKPLKSDSDLARNIGSGARPNCKDGLPGGLLAPIFLLLDKKDSGCKW